jgi:hypothetical protein
MNMFQNLKFESKMPGLPTVELDSLAEFLSRDIQDGEINNGSNIDYTKWSLPLFQVPNQFKALLSYSNGGLIVNGDREFGYFGKKELREYYLNYEFPFYMPGILPIAFNGGGVFYAYDLRENTQNPHIIAVSSGVLDWDCAYYLGNCLLEVLSKNNNIEDEEP